MTLRDNLFLGGVLAFLFLRFWFQRFAPTAVPSTVQPFDAQTESSLTKITEGLVKDLQAQLEDEVFESFKDTFWALPMLAKSKLLDFDRQTAKSPDHEKGRLDLKDGIEEVSVAFAKPLLYQEFADTISRNEELLDVFVKEKAWSLTWSTEKALWLSTLDDGIDALLAACKIKVQSDWVFEIVTEDEKVDMQERFKEFRTLLAELADEQRSSYLKGQGWNAAKKIAWLAGGALAGPHIVVAGVHAAGFGTAGIAAGTLAAKTMAALGTGSKLVAAAQSIGATSTAGSCASAAGATVANIVDKMLPKEAMGEAGRAAHEKAQGMFGRFKAWWAEDPMKDRPQQEDL